MSKKEASPIRVAAENRKARHEYFVEDTIEAGIMLVGTEVKSLRNGRANIAEAYANVEQGELWLINSHIPPYEQGNRQNHEERRKRKLLVSGKQLHRLAIAIQREGMTIAPLKLYFNEKGRAKLLIGLAKGKKLHDKRAVDKQRDWQREKQRLFRNNG